MQRIDRTQKYKSRRLAVLGLVIGNYFGGCVEVAFFVSNFDVSFRCVILQCLSKEVNVAQLRVLEDEVKVISNVRKAVSE